MGRTDGRQVKSKKRTKRKDDRTDEQKDQKQKGWIKERRKVGRKIMKRK
jgi:hypothetical protein